MYLSNRGGDINEKVRAVLVDWYDLHHNLMLDARTFIFCLTFRIVDVCRHFRLMSETLFLSIHILDKYLEKVNTPRERVQLIGVASMLIASKYEEIFFPEINDL